MDRLDQKNLITLGIGALTTAFLFWVRAGLRASATRLGARPLLVAILTKAAGVILSIPLLLYRTSKPHVAKVKGPVMDHLQKSHFLRNLNGQVFLSQFDAWQALKPITPTTKMAQSP